MKKKKLSQICQINPPKAICLPAYQEVTFLPMENISVDGQVNTSKTISVTKVRNYAVFKNGDVLFAKITPCMENGKGCIVKNLCNGYGAGSTELVVLRPNNEAVLAEWLYYFLSQKQFRLQCQHHMTGSAGQKRVPPKYLGMCEIPVPTIDEQKRIVSRIEELFSQLDSGVETLKTVKRQLEVYRQAVSKDVFDGISTIGETCSIKDVCTDIKVGIVIKPAQYYTDSNHGIKAFRSANVHEFNINDRDWVYLTPEGHAINKRSEVNAGDVLIVRSGYPGTACVVTPEFDGCNAIDILIAKPDKNKIIPEYLCAYTNSPYGRKLVNEKKRGVAQAHLNVSGYSQMSIFLPSKDIQKRAVNEISARLSVCDNIEKTVDTALQQAEAMRQSILKQAFEGRLR